MRIAKKHKLFGSRVVTFGPESCRVQATDKDLDLRLEMTATRRQMIDVQLQSQMEKHQINEVEGK